jgi:hypothetical protein
MIKVNLSGIALVVIIAMSLLLGLGIGCRISPDPEKPATDTVYVDRPLVVRDTVKFTVAETVTVYEPGETVVVERCLEVPEQFVDVRADTVVPTFRGVRDSGVLVRADRVRLTTWDFALGTWVQHEYRVPNRRWDWGIDLESTFYPDGLLVATYGTLSYKDVSVGVGPYVDVFENNAGLSGRITYRVFGR